MNTENYKDKGIPLSASIAEGLILEIFAGQTKAKQIIVKAVVKTHKDRGGEDSKAKDVNDMMKKTLANLKKKELATNPRNGYWSVSGDVDSELNGDESVEKEADNLEVVETPNNIEADKTLGEGNSSVYVYYYPAYQKLAEMNKDKLWECKVGMSERDPINRVLSQTGTALPERPTLALLIKTNDAKGLESTLHHFLTINNKKLPDSPGSEWFKTNPSEIEELYEVRLRPRMGQ